VGVNTHSSLGSRVPYRINPGRHTPGHMNRTGQLKSEKILKATREQQQVTYKGTPRRLSADFFSRNCRPEESGMIYLK